MNMNDIIIKKRDGHKLSKEEISYFIKNYVDGMIPDYQASALLMAIFFRDMDSEELFNLTNEMRYSGDTMDLSAIKGIKVDKHSTGGVGDKTTLIVAPLAASCGVPIAKMSGRGLGFTGGTVDKMESIPGFKTSMEPEDFINQVNAIGMAVIGQTAHITPADKKIYALRDVTGTVDKLPLIASSIMSKKLAAGSDAILLDVKCGSGAFMHSIEDACKLGETMVSIGKDAGRNTMAVVTDMNQPLGYAVGNSLEVIEVIETLKGNGPEDITELSLNLAAMMVHMGEKAGSFEEAFDMVKDSLESGRGLEKLEEFIEAQGGNPKVCQDYSLFPQAAHVMELKAPKTGYITAIDAQIIGEASQLTGAGRATKEDEIDLSAGIMLCGKIGTFVEEENVLLKAYGNDIIKLQNAMELVKDAFQISDKPVENPRLIKKLLKQEL